MWTADVNDRKNRRSMRLEAGNITDRLQETGLLTLAGSGFVHRVVKSQLKP